MRSSLLACLSKLSLLPALIALGLAGQALADTATHTLTRSIAIAAGSTVEVQNLVGRMTVSPGGGTLEVTATVVAGGKDRAAAEALTQTVKLSVETAGNRVSVHVDYPVDQYDSYRYDGRGDRQLSSGCILGIFCVQSTSDLSYQGHRVRIHQNSGDGAPLHVDVAIKLPAGASADLTNYVGFIKVLNVKNNLGLHSDSGDMQVNQVTGNLNIDTGSGDIGIANQDGATVVHTGSGDVAVRDVKGNLNIHTGSGDVSGGNLQGDTLETVTGSGDVVLDGLSGALNLRAGSGDIHLTGIKAHGGTAVHTGSGDITLNGDLSGMSDFNLRAGSGDITLITSQPPAVHLDITTGSGDIEVHWPGVNNVTASDDSFSGDIGTAKATGQIHTGSGDVILKR
ncbi:MAG: DUF4097 family beta strand repeat protein [Gammaproteobacteria bacterium]|nr:DUF4097 family beta strand repeat protein [Gammaproteobacteria bacterium]